MIFFNYTSRASLHISLLRHHDVVFKITALYRDALFFFIIVITCLHDCLRLMFWSCDTSVVSMIY